MDVEFGFHLDIHMHIIHIHRYTYAYVCIYIYILHSYNTGKIIMLHTAFVVCSTSNLPVSQFDLHIYVNLPSD